MPTTNLVTGDRNANRIRYQLGTGFAQPALALPAAWFADGTAGYLRRITLRRDGRFDIHFASDTTTTSQTADKNLAPTILERLHLVMTYPFTLAGNPVEVRGFTGDTTEPYRVGAATLVSGNLVALNDADTDNFNVIGPATLSLEVLPFTGDADPTAWSSTLPEATGQAVSPGEQGDADPTAWSSTLPSATGTVMEPPEDTIVTRAGVGAGLRGKFIDQWVSLARNNVEFTGGNWRRIQVGATGWTFTQTTRPGEEAGDPAIPIGQVTNNGDIVFVIPTANHPQPDEIQIYDAAVGGNLLVAVARDNVVNDPEVGDLLRILSGTLVYSEDATQN